MTTVAAPLLIDVRSEGEYAAAHLERSICLPLADIGARIEQLVPDKQQPLLLFCASGVRSDMAMRLLQSMGYHQVENGGGAGQVAMRLGCAVVRG